MYLMQTKVLAENLIDQKRQLKKDARIDLTDKIISEF